MRGFRAGLQESESSNVHRVGEIEDRNLKKYQEMSVKKNLRRSTWHFEWQFFRSDELSSRECRLFE